MAGNDPPSSLFQLKPVFSLQTSAPVNFSTVGTFSAVNKPTNTLTSGTFLPVKQFSFGEPSITTGTVHSSAFTIPKPTTDVVPASTSGIFSGENVNLAATTSFTSFLSDSSLPLPQMFFSKRAPDTNIETSNDSKSSLSIQTTSHSSSFVPPSSGASQTQTFSFRNALVKKAQTFSSKLTPQDGLFSENSESILSAKKEESAPKTTILRSKSIDKSKFATEEGDQHTLVSAKMDVKDLTSVVCKNLHPDDNKKEVLLHHFSKFGKVEKVMRNVKQNYAVIRFADHKSAETAKKNGSLISRVHNPVSIYWCQKSSAVKREKDKESYGRDVEDELKAMTEGAVEHHLLERPPEENVSPLLRKPRLKDQKETEPKIKIQREKELRVKAHREKERVKESREKERMKEPQKKEQVKAQRDKELLKLQREKERVKEQRLKERSKGQQEKKQKVKEHREKEQRLKKQEKEQSIKDRAAKTATVLKTKKDTSSSSQTPTVQEEALIKVILQEAHTSEKRYLVLDARDKLMRLNWQQRLDLKKAKVVVGTCLDMCPEKERYRRFNQNALSAFEQKNSNSSQLEHKIVVKEYSRSSANQEEPLPHELRPPESLRFTMDYLLCCLMDKIDDPEIPIGEWYDFIWNRTRSIRKDITQQYLGDITCVEIVEKCARFHIHCGAALCDEEMAVFDRKINNENLTKCLQTLKHCYDDLAQKQLICPNEPEFRAYDILLSVNDGAAVRPVQKMRSDVQNSPEVKFAVSVAFAFSTNNYVRFFKLVNSTTYLNACILHRYFNEVRVQALKIIVKAYCTPIRIVQYPIDDLVSLLKFEDISEAIEFCQLLGLKSNRKHVVLDRATFSVPVNPVPTNRSLIVVESKKESSLGEVINQGPLSKSQFDLYEPSNSFDESGHLKKEVVQALDQFITKKEQKYLVDVEMRSESVSGSSVAPMLPTSISFTLPATVVSTLPTTVASMIPSAVIPNLPATSAVSGSVPSFKFNLAVGETVVPGISQSVVPAVSQTVMPVIQQIVTPAVNQTAASAIGQTTTPAVSQTVMPIIQKITTPAVSLTAASAVSQTVTPAISQIPHMTISTVSKSGPLNIFSASNAATVPIASPANQFSFSIVPSTTTTNLQSVSTISPVIPFSIAVEKPKDVPTHEKKSEAQKLAVVSEDAFCIVQDDCIEKLLRTVATEALHEEKELCRKIQRDTLLKNIGTLAKHLISEVVQEEIMIYLREEFTSQMNESRKRMISSTFENIMEEGVEAFIFDIIKDVYDHEKSVWYQQLEDLKRKRMMRHARKAFKKWQYFCIKKRRAAACRSVFPSGPIMQFKARPCTGVVLDNAIHAFAVQETSARLLGLGVSFKAIKEELSWLPLDLTSIFENALIEGTQFPQMPSSAHFWKLLLVTYEEDDENTNSELSTFYQWIRMKFSKRCSGNKLFDSTNVSSLYWLTNLSSHRIAVCVRTLAINTKTFKSTLSDLKKTFLLDGTMAILTLLPITCAQKLPENYQQCLQQLLEEMSPIPSIPLYSFILKSDGASCSLAQEYYHQLKKASLICDYDISALDLQKDLYQLSDKVLVAVEWLVKRCPEVPKVVSKSLKDYFQDGMLEVFRVLYQDVSHQRNQNNLYQDVESIISLYNTSISHRASVASSSLLKSVSWPLPEIASSEKYDASWKADKVLKQLGDIIRSCSLPVFVGSSLSLRDVTLYVHKLAAQFDKTAYELFSSVADILEKALPIRSENDEYFIPWVDVLQECVHYLYCHKIYFGAQTEDELQVFYLQEELEELDLPAKWAEISNSSTVIEIRHDEILQNQGSLVVSNKRSLEKYDKSDLVNEPSEKRSKNNTSELEMSFKQEKEESDAFLALLQSCSADFAEPTDIKGPETLASYPLAICSDSSNSDENSDESKENHGPFSSETLLLKLSELKQSIEAAKHADENFESVMETLSTSQ